MISYKFFFTYHFFHLVSINETMLDESTIHILSGGIGGTVGAIVTCPLELIKVRFQSSQGGALTGYASMLNSSSTASHHHPSSSVATSSGNPSILLHRAAAVTVVTNPPATKFEIPAPTPASVVTSPAPSPGQLCNNTGLIVNQKGRAFHPNDFFLLRSKIIRCMVEVGQTEGYRALFKGLIPTLFGVLPSR